MSGGGIVAGGGGGGASFPLTGNVGAIGAVSTDALALTNTQAATVGAQQWSPRLHFTGSGWKTNATAGPQTLDFIQELQVVQGSASPIPQLTWSYQRNAGGYNVAAQLTDAAGQTTGNIGYLQLNIGSAGNGSIAPISTADHVNMTRGGSGGVTLGFGAFNSSADLGQIGIAIGGMTGVANAPTYTSVGPSNVVGVGTGDASGLNIAGGNTTVFGGRSTGSGVGGDILLQTTVASGSSSTLNALATRWTIKGTGGLFSPNAASGDKGADSINTVTYYSNGNANPSARATAAQGGPLVGADTNFISYSPPGSANRYALRGVLNMNAWTTPATFNITCSYKDDGGVARTETLAVTRGSTGAVAAAVTAVDRWFFEIPMFATDASGTAITCSTAGVFTGSPSYSMFAQLYLVQ